VVWIECFGDCFEKAEGAAAARRNAVAGLGRGRLATGSCLSSMASCLSFVVCGSRLGALALIRGGGVNAGRRRQLEGAGIKGLAAD